jgi:hypothetical protein
MNRRFVELVLACIVLSNCGWGQEIRIFNREVQAHGFVSQGFVDTDQNNWLTMNSSQGSAAMTEMGLNASSQLTDKLRVGAQVYDLNLGQLGQWHPSLDWALADYRFSNWFGVRAGKVKTTLGLYNDSQDLDFLRVFALLPQGVYPTDMRQVTIAHTGGDLYGNISLPHHLGDLSYTGYAGRRSDSLYSGYPYLFVNWMVFFKELGGLQYGGDLRWNTPLKGLTIGTSRLNQELTGKGKFINLLNPNAGLLPYECSTKKDWTNQFYAQFLYRRFRLDGEYRRLFDYVPYIPGADVSTDIHAWYIAGSYRIHKRVEVGSYYSRYTDRGFAGGALAVVVPNDTDSSHPKNHVYDKVVAARVDLNRFVYVKIEGHFMDGYGMGSYPDGFYPQQNPLGFKPDTNALVVKTGFHF